jgi:hypothetical protein
MSPKEGGGGFTARVVASAVGGPPRQSAGCGCALAALVGSADTGTMTLSSAVPPSSRR